MNKDQIIQLLRDKADTVWAETLRLHRRAPETRIASSLSCVEILTVLYYGGILKFSPSRPCWSRRDRLIVSKGHGSISLYPILADLGYFPRAALADIGKPGSFLGSIPDPLIPGYETINGSLGHGLGVGCGMATGLRLKKSSARVWVLVGDGELYEGSNWEAVMFAAHHGLDNLTLIIDHNRIAMLDYCQEIIKHEPLAEKFLAFGWEVIEVDGHDVSQLRHVLKRCNRTGGGRPKVVIAHTVKGRGTPLANDSLCHVKSLSNSQLEQLLGGEIL